MIDLITRDDQSQPSVALTRVEELITRRKVIALTGGELQRFSASCSWRQPPPASPRCR
jgi:ABC-type branched-subunit amino acid transport system substrate-binding protein